MKKSILIAFLALCIGTALESVRYYKLVKKLWLPGSAGVTALAVLPEGRIASGSTYGTIMIWDVESGDDIATLRGDYNPVRALLVLPDEKLASIHGSRNINIWNLKINSLQATLRPPMSQYLLSDISALALLPDGIILAGSAEGYINMWTPHSKGNKQTYLLWETFLNRENVGDRPSPIHDIAAFPDGRFATAVGVAGVVTNKIKIWNPLTDETAVWRAHQDTITAFAELPDGRLASLAGSEIKIWNPTTHYEELVIVTDHVVPRLLVAFSNGNLASGGGSERENTIKIWNSTTGELEVTIPNTTRSTISSLAVLSDDRLAVGSADGSISIYEIKEVKNKKVE